MLDADSVFERLLREATNLVPKMSTPKLTAALKASSNLQHRITDTLSLRLQQQGNVIGTDAKSFAMQDIQPIVGGSISTDELIPDSAFLIANDTHFTNRPIPSANYTGIPFFPQLNQFAVSQRTATLVTITNPNAGVPTSAPLPGAIRSSTLPPAPPMTTQSLFVATASAPSTVQQHHQPPPTGVVTPLMIQQQPTQKQEVYRDLVPASTVDAGTATADAIVTTNSNSVDIAVTVTNPATTDVCPPLVTTCIAGTAPTTATPAFFANGHILTVPTSCLEGVDLKPDPVACLGRDLSNSAFSTSTLPNPIATTDIDPSQQQPSSNLGAFPITSDAASDTLDTNVTAGVVVMAAQPPPPTTTTAGSKSAASRSATAMAVSAVGGGPYRCTHCGKEFRVLRYLEKHKRIHTGEKPYQCCYCGRQFNDWPNMNRHKRIHTGERPYRCSVCSKTFSQPAVYNEHLKRHTGERPYVCTVCSKGFPRPARLAVHMRVHTGERPYPCAVCDRRFSQPHHLSAHIRIHSGERPFSCPKCDATFGCLANLRRHRRQAHPLTAFPATAVSKGATNADSTTGTSLQTTDAPQLQRLLPLGTEDDACTPTLRTNTTTTSEATHCSNGNDKSMLTSHSSDTQIQNSSDATTEEITSTALGLEGNSIDGGGDDGLSASISTVAEALISQAQHLMAVSNGGDDFQIPGTLPTSSAQLPPQHLYDASGTIYLNTVDVPPTVGAVGTTLVPATSTITSTLPQIQIHQVPHQQQQAFAFAEPHTLQQAQPIHICYSATGATSTGEVNPTTIILPRNAQMFGQMLVPIGPGSNFPAYTTTHNGTAFPSAPQQLTQIQQQTVAPVHITTNPQSQSQIDALSMSVEVDTPSPAVAPLSESLDAEQQRTDV